MGDPSLSSTVTSAPRPYRAFTIVPTPYPGCEFFALYRANGRSPVGLVFDWQQSFVDSLLQLELEMEGLELSEDGDGEETYYEDDTHWPCWEKQQKEKGQVDYTAPLPSHSITQPSSSASHPQPTQYAAEREGSSPLVSSAPDPPPSLPLVSRLKDAVEGKEEDDDGAHGHIAASSSDSATLPLQWKDYREWSVVTLTKNYLLLLLHTLSPSSSASFSPASPSGFSIHCVSGWDRTPLFISLLRLSLWADGEAHPSLSPLQMLYLTLGYDWCLFSHHLANRHGKGEDVLYFCFDFLQFITSHKFRLPSSQRRKQHKRSAAPPPQPTPSPPLHDAYFTDAVTTSPSTSTSSSSTSSAPIPIPRKDRPPSRHPPLTCPPPPQTSTSSSAIPRGGSWTMIDVLNQRSGKHSNASDSSSEGGEDKDGLATSPLNLRSPATQPVVHTHSPPSSCREELVKSWSAEWRPSEAADEVEADEAQEDEEDHRRAALRCERLMAVRSLFLEMYHTVVPSSPVAPILSSAPVCPHFTQAKTVALTIPMSSAPAPSIDPIDRAQSSSPLESMRSFSGSGEEGGKGSRMNLLGWMPF
ncbi:hypothetical protein RGQ29_032158 [Quercus rubra]|uniref:Myotubularin phosphatase domain-containing protein n=1 Tax=Quercus rubra TaxID=3512 RepID=A0AAN7I4V4_QUERU|nr:hypothetical protein RGQ29_032158 [Quercus rubra]